MVKESDWKKFQSMIPNLRERFLAEQNTRIQQTLTAADRNETERFWDAFKLMNKMSKELDACLDDISRSSMEMKMLMMFHVRMLVPEDLVGFSDDLQARLTRKSVE